MIFKKNIGLKNSLLLLVVGLFLSITSYAEIKFDSKWTENYIIEHIPKLLENSESDHIMAFYYFGSFEDYTVSGMERIKGSEYESHHTVFIFKDSILQGYYEGLLAFPAGVSKQGQIFFPANRSANTVIDIAQELYPEIIFSKQPETATVYTKLLPSSN